MSLVDKKSNLDRHNRLDAGPNLEIGNQVGQNPPSEGNFFTAGGSSDSPFDGQDHLRELLEDKVVKSDNSGLTYDPSLMQGLQPGPPAGDQDFDGLNGPQFQRGLDAANKVHQSSLSLVPGPPSNSPFQDRPDSSATSTPSGYKESGGPADGLY